MCTVRMDLRMVALSNLSQRESVYVPSREMPVSRRSTRQQGAEPRRGRMPRFRIWPTGRPIV